MDLMLPERDQTGGRLVLEKGELAGHAYRVQPRICDNPVCECKKFSLDCFPESSAEAAGSPSPVTLELDLERRALDKPELSEAGPAGILARGVMDEMTSEQWHYLWTYFYCLKIRYTESANLDDLDTDFPANVTEGGMVGYYEILPFARPINFTVGEREWVFDDQYCVRPDCSCQAAVLQWFRTGPQIAGAPPSGPNLSLRYDYANKRFENIERSRESPSPEAFLDAMRQGQPDFDAFLAKRHAQLRHLYRLFLKRHRGSRGDSRNNDADSLESIQNFRPTPVRAEPRPGRNDPCPCGSGKKYKKCCGQI